MNCKTHTAMFIHLGLFFKPVNLKLIWYFISVKKSLHEAFMSVISTSLHIVRLYHLYFIFSERDTLVYQVKYPFFVSFDAFKFFYHSLQTYYELNVTNKNCINAYITLINI